MTDEDIQRLIDEAFDHYKDDIAKLGYDFKWNKIIFFDSDKNKWVDNKVKMQKLAEK